MGSVGEIDGGVKVKPCPKTHDSERGSVFSCRDVFEGGPESGDPPEKIMIQYAEKLSTLEQLRAFVGSHLDKA